MWLQDLLQELTFSNHAYGTELRDETAQLYRDMASDATCVDTFQRGGPRLGNAGVPSGGTRRLTNSKLTPREHRDTPTICISLKFHVS